MNKIKVLSLILLCCAQLQNATFAENNSTNEQKNIPQFRYETIKTGITEGYQASRKYTLGPNDVISISLYNVPELNQNKIRVQPDGKINITPIGSLNVSGLTIDELHKMLYEKYNNFLQKPEISVNLDQSRPFIVYVTGAVMNPGSYEMDTNTEKQSYTENKKPEISIERKTPLLTNVLVAAGGISYDADLENIEISNKFDNSKFKVNLLELLDKSDSSQDMYLMAGDTVHIPKLVTPLAITDAKYKKYASASFSPGVVPIKVFGYVKEPGIVKLDPGQSLNINSAITGAGGYLTDSAYAPTKIYLSRADASGKLVTRVVNPMSNDITVFPNDIVYVPEKARPTIGKAFDFLARMANPVSTIAAGYNNWALMFDPTRYQVYGGGGK